ncbi:MAG: hypothetical protein IPH72_27040 [Sandaracinaceae bacterium]|nr:hypothetical protein [Sandaracinaceae bacterium]
MDAPPPRLVSPNCTGWSLGAGHTMASTRSAGKAPPTEATIATALARWSLSSASP